MTRFKPATPRPEDNAATQAVSKEVIQAVLAAAEAREASGDRQTARPPAPPTDPAVFDAPTARRSNPLLDAAPDAPAHVAELISPSPIVAPVLAPPTPIREIVADPFYMIAASSVADVDATTVTARHSAAPLSRVRVSRFVAIAVFAAAVGLVGTVAVRTVTPGLSSRNAGATQPSTHDLAPARETVPPALAAVPVTAPTAEGAPVPVAEAAGAAGEAAPNVIPATASSTSPRSPARTSDVAKTAASTPPPKPAHDNGSGDQVTTPSTFAP